MALLLLPLANVLPAIHLKLARDLFRLKGQVITIALVVASGIASFVTLQGTYASLQRARATFYERQRFADVFAELERAPKDLERELERLPGVERVQTRIVKPAMLPLESRSEPLGARVIELPPAGEEALDAIELRDGRRPEADHPDEAVLLQGFADAHRIHPGDRLPAVINGKKRLLSIVGVAISAEYVMAIGPGDFTGDPERFAVIWMNAAPLEASFRMEGAFNDVAVALAPGASQTAVIDSVDRALVRYGGLGAYDRSRQSSNHIVEGELLQLRAMSTVLPGIFLAVAALLVHVVLSRLVHLQKQEIATLKAVGYSNWEVGLHFLELVILVSLLGATLGLALGSWIGTWMIDLYERYFKFPELSFRLDARDAALATAITVLAAATGALGSVRGAVNLPPAEAMQPPTPARYRRSLVDRLRLAPIVGPSAHMVVRELERRPVRAALSVLAIAAATGLSVVAGFYYDGMEALLETQFHGVMREDAAVTFIEPRPERAIGELAHLPGVTSAEGVRLVPVIFRNGHRHRDAVIWGYRDGAEMRALRDKLGRDVALPPDGIVLTDVLADLLGLRIGDAIDVQIQEKERATKRLVVAGFVDESFGLQGHMRYEALRRALGEQPRVSLGLLRVDPRADAELDKKLKDLPFVAEVSRRARMLERFQEQSASMITTVAAIIALFAATITIGVVYNNARIALALRARDLASLRVLGFTRGEISAVLLGELAVQVLVALPIGLVFGRWLVGALAGTTDPETYRLPVLLTSRSYAFAAAITLIAALASALVVRRRIDRLDLVAVLKTRE